MYPVKNVPEYDGMNYSMSSDKVPRLCITSDHAYSKYVARITKFHP